MNADIFRLNMPGKPSKKSHLTDAERKIITQMKIELNEQNIPRNQWASLIQEKINENRRQSSRHRQISSSKSKKGLFFQIRRKFRKLMIKMFSRKMMSGSSGVSDEMLDQMMDMMDNYGNDPNAAMNAFLPDYTTNIADKVSEPSSRKKMKVIMFDDDSDLENDEDPEDDDDIFEDLD